MVRMTTLRILKHIVRPDGVTLHSGSRILRVQAQPRPAPTSGNGNIAATFAVLHAVDNRLDRELTPGEIANLPPLHAFSAEDAVSTLEARGYTDVEVVVVPLPPHCGDEETAPSGMLVLWEEVDDEAFRTHETIKAPVSLITTGQVFDAEDVAGKTYLDTVQYIGSDKVVHVYVDLRATGSILINQGAVDITKALADLSAQWAKHSESVKASASSTIDSAATVIANSLAKISARIRPSTPVTPPPAPDAGTQH
jgi:hypothetical protein